MCEGRLSSYALQEISVYFTARRYGSLDAGETYLSAMKKLAEISREMVDNYVVDNILRPLQQTIAIK